MQIWQQYKGYISVLLLLLLARFVWQPMWLSKQEHWLQLQYSENAQHKARALLALEQDMQQVQQDMQQLLALAEAKLGNGEDLTQFKLHSQQQLEQLFLQHNMQITLSSWREGLAEGGVQTLVLDLRFNGKLKHFLTLLNQLQQSAIIPSMVIIEQQLTIRGQTEVDMGNVDGSISIRLAVARQEEP
ncbi:hypothetical protein [Rheinheimera metallidurans]|uniref:hypothetical protein n=1 Tax=Rheinheimera metallidurans TaxID=2925781 RepID=UPI0030013597